MPTQPNPAASELTEKQRKDLILEARIEGDDRYTMRTSAQAFLKGAEFMLAIACEKFEQLATPVHQAAASEAEAVKVEAKSLPNALTALRTEALEVFDGPETPQDVRDVIEWYSSSISVILDGARRKFDAVVRGIATPTPQAAEPALRATTDTVSDDTKRLDWLDQQAKAYGFADVHEGNVWEVGGGYRTVRDCIDSEMLAARPPADGATKEGASHE